VSETSQETRTELDQLLTKGKDKEEKLLESVEERVEELTDNDYHYSLDIIHADNHSIRVGVYGVEGLEKPSRQTVAEAVSEQFGWTAAYEDGESTSSHYEMRVLDWENDFEPL